MKSLRIITVLVNIQTRHLSNINEKHYYLSELACYDHIHLLSYLAMQETCSEAVSIENNVLSNSRLIDFAVNPEGICAGRFICQFCDFSTVKLIELGQHKIKIMVLWIPTFP
jgi:hypothetical protein